MFKVFKAFVRKEFYHILRDKRTLLILFGMPVAQVLIFGFAVTNEFKNTEIDVLDYAKDTTSEQLINHIQSSGNFIVNAMLTSEQEMEDGFKAGESKLIVVIPENFSADFYANKRPEIQVITDGSDPNNANTLVQYITQMVNSFQTEKTTDATSPFQIQTATRMLYNPQLESAYNFVPGVVALILLIICAMLTSLTIAKEQEMGTMEVLLVSPLPPIIIIIGKVTPYAILSFGIALSVLLMGNIIFSVPIVGSFGLLMLMCLLYVITALSLGTLISTKSDTQQKAMMTSLMSLMMPSMLLSGFLFPMSSMPKILQWIGHIIPTKWFIDILKAVMLRGVGIDFILLEVGVLILMTVVLLFATWRSFKIRLE